MRTAVAAIAEARVASSDLYIEMGVADAVANLIKTARGEYGKRTGKDGLPAKGKACGGAQHIGLGNSHIKKPVGEFLLKQVVYGGARKVGVQHHNALVCAIIDERAAICTAG